MLPNPEPTVQGQLYGLVRDTETLGSAYPPWLELIVHIGNTGRHI